MYTGILYGEKNKSEGAFKDAKATFELGNYFILLRNILKSFGGAQSFSDQSRLFCSSFLNAC